MSDDDLPDTELADTLAAEAPATEAYAWSREGTLPAWEYPRRDWRRFALPGAVALVAMFAAAVAGTILLAPRPSHHEAIRPVQPAPIQAPMPAFPPNARDAFAWLLSERGLSISDATSDQDNRRLCATLYGDSDQASRDRSIQQAIKRGQGGTWGEEESSYAVHAAIIAYCPKFDR